MNKMLGFVAALQCSACFCFAQVNVRHLLTENLDNPIGLDSRSPRFSWQLVSSRRQTAQTAYELAVSGSPDVQKRGWSSGRMGSDRSLHVPYTGPALESGKKYYWRVRVWDNLGHPSPWSATAW